MLIPSMEKFSYRNYSTNRVFEISQDDCRMEVTVQIGVQRFPQTIFTKEDVKMDIVRFPEITYKITRFRLKETVLKKLPCYHFLYDPIKCTAYLVQKGQYRKQHRPIYDELLEVLTELTYLTLSQKIQERRERY